LKGDISMTAITKKTTVDNSRDTTSQESVERLRDLAVKTGRFILHLLEMLVAMEVGMGIFHLVIGLIRTYSSFTGLESGTTLHAITMTVFMTVPMVAWMMIRGHGWRHGAEMVIAMIAPVILIGLLCQLGVDEYLPWLAGASAPAMLIGMIGAMLYRREHYTRGKSHPVKEVRVEEESEPPCH
jgi:hypothetical protein